ncbi:MAG: hypothetical protein K0Q72_5061, partial [Armatimonadetes bacterium]|nr:hypothetical protein [Armatimonadota bacterium]
MDHSRPEQLIVELRGATLPSVLRAIALHHWFVVIEPETGSTTRWEVWQNRDAGGQSWGHLHRNLMHADRPVGGGPSFTVATWTGDDARRLQAVLEQPDEYPFREVYRYWPGPNSNTYAAWVLARAGLLHDFDPRGIGKDFVAPYGFGLSRCAGSTCLSSPLIGARWGRHVGLELHLLGLTLGIGHRPLRLKTPLGLLRLG